MMRSTLVILVGALLVAGCAFRENFTSQGNTEIFVQDYNPETIDVLWVVDNRSPMYQARNHLISEATAFFTRLDGAARDYQMAFATMDMEVAPGQLKPNGAPIFTSKVGTLQERTTMFSNLLAQMINLSTGPSNKGLESARVILLSKFVPRKGIPLVLVFISDSEDSSAVAAGEDRVEVYTDAFLAMKENRKDLLRVYSVNYRALNTGEAASSANRCATRYGYDPVIDQSGYKSNYSKLAEKISDNPSTVVTADLCGAFASLIDITGLKLKALPSRFKLKAAASPDSIRVSVVREGVTMDADWTYDAATQEVVFSSVAPEGSTITIIYRPL